MTLIPQSSLSETNPDLSFGDLNSRSLLAIAADGVTAQEYLDDRVRQLLTSIRALVNREAPKLAAEFPARRYQVYDDLMPCYRGHFDHFTIKDDVLLVTTDYPNDCGSCYSTDEWPVALLHQQNTMEGTELLDTLMARRVTAFRLARQEEKDRHEATLRAEYAALKARFEPPTSS